MGGFLIGLPGRDYPVGYLIALVFFILALILFIVSFFIKDENSKSQKLNKKNEADAKSDESDIYSQEHDSPALEYTENFAEEIIKMIEAEEKAEEAAKKESGNEDAGLLGDTIVLGTVDSISADNIKD